MFFHDIGRRCKPIAVFSAVGGLVAVHFHLQNSNKSQGLLTIYEVTRGFPQRQRDVVRDSVTMPSDFCLVRF